MKAFAMLGLDRVGWIEKPRPECGPLDAIVRPIAVSPCTSDVHTVFEGALGDRRDMILGHEAVGEVVEVGALVRDFRPGDRVIVTAITPDWGSLEAQRGYAMHSGGMLAGWKFSNFKDGVFAEFFQVNEADANLARLPEDMEPGAAAMLCDMMPTGLHAAELAEVQFGEDVARHRHRAGRIDGGCGLPAARRGEHLCRRHAGQVPRGRRGLRCKSLPQLPRRRSGRADPGADAGTRRGQGLHRGRRRGHIRRGHPHGQAGRDRRLGQLSRRGRFCEHSARGMGLRHGAQADPRRADAGGRLRAERLAAMVETGRIDPSLMITHRFHGFGHIEEALLLMKNKPADLIKPVVYLD